MSRSVKTSDSHKITDLIYWLNQRGRMVTEIYRGPTDIHGIARITVETQSGLVQFFRPPDYLSDEFYWFFHDDDQEVQMLFKLTWGGR